MISAQSLTLAASLLCSGLMAGFFFGWSVSVIPGNAVIDDRSYIITMQSINRKIVNPWFVVPFLVTPLVLMAGALLHVRAGQARRGTLLAAASLTYLLGVLAVTAGRNVPLNNALAKSDLTTATTDIIRTERVNYETPWNRWHTLRTLASVTALGLTSLACTLSEGE